MNIIGVSGIQGTIPFKKSRWPGLEEREYRISQGHDSAAALIADGCCVAAAAEERFSRKKHTGDFPVEAISYCLDEGKLSLGDIDLIVHGFDYEPYEKVYSLDPVSADLYRDVYSRAAFLKLVDRHLPGFPADRVKSVGHHLAHAASAYFTSGWDDALVMVMDGMGEIHSASIYQACGGSLKLLRQAPVLDSLGILYSLVTLHLGFEFNSDEYKIMGLAPYGQRERFRSFFDDIATMGPDGSVRLRLLRMEKSRDDREHFTNARRYLSEHLLPARRPDEELRDEHRDVAASLQDFLERAVVHICCHFARSTGMRRIAMAGGVALNCTANGRLLNSGLFDEVYVQPAAGDDGAALGAALWGAASFGENRNERYPVPFFGPGHSSSEIEQAITESAGEIEVTRFDSLEETCAEAARLIAQGRVLGWYRGRMEYGPRALGHRSILADPAHPEMRARINSMIKMREAFRPFAPAVSLEQVHDWFEVPPMTELPHMTIIVDVREQHRSLFPAITHVDGSARVQTVSGKDNHEFHALLQAVGRITGREMVLNTSFNVNKQPIVNTPREAIDTFLGSGIDCLFLEDILVTRRG